MGKWRVSEKGDIYNQEGGHFWKFEPYSIFQKQWLSHQKDQNGNIARGRANSGHFPELPCWVHQQDTFQV